MHLAEALQREWAPSTSLLKTLRHFLSPLGLLLMLSQLLLPCSWVFRDPWVSPEEFAPCRRVQQVWAQPRAQGSLSAAGACWMLCCWYPSDMCKLCLFSFLILSSPDFFSACCTPGHGKEDSTSWFVIEVLLRISWRDPLSLSSYHTKYRNHICLTPVCFAFCYEFISRITSGARGNDQRIGTISVWKNIKICLKCFDLMMSNVETVL